MTSSSASSSSSARAVHWFEQLASSLAPLRRLRIAMMRDLLLPATEGSASMGGDGWDVAPPVTPAGLLTDKVVLVTGGSSGIGLAVAKRLAAAGAQVIICGRDEQKLVEARRAIADEGGGAQVCTYAVDMSDLAACDAFVDQLKVEHGGVDILINNAGRSIRRTVAESVDRFHDFQRTMQLNYFAALRLTLGLLPGMERKRAGHVINISSIGVLLNAPRFSAYVASKAALEGWAHCAASEYADKGIQFTTINMPLVRTAMIAPTTSYDDVPALTPAQAADLVVDAIVRRPARIATGVGVVSDVLHAVAPRAMRGFGNLLYRRYPDRHGKSAA
jgi:NAD(P)-dependent dehydrogenase (short-subunit alcohol dehydrogenase family)